MSNKTDMVECYSNLLAFAYILYICINFLCERHNNKTYLDFNLINKSVNENVMVILFQQNVNGTNGITCIKIINICFIL